MLVVIDRDGRVVARVGTEERARKIQRMARDLGRSTLVHDERDPRGRAVLDRQVRVVLTNHEERLFGEPPDASAWAMRHLREKMTIGAQARFYRGSSRSPYSVLKLTERGVVVTRGANVGSTV